jgi:hypothetical protein
MIVLGGIPANFNYVDPLGATGLFVAGIIVDITTGSPVVLGSPVAMTDLGNGAYVGVFTPVLGHFYTVVSASYVDSGFTTLDTSRAPAAAQFDTFSTDTTQFSFNYATYDFDSGLTINATVENLVAMTETSFAMTPTILGVYFGMYTGAVGDNFVVTKIPTDGIHAPAADSFQCFTIFSGAQIELVAATLIGQSLNAILVET